MRNTLSNSWNYLQCDKNTASAVQVAGIVNASQCVYYACGTQTNVVTTRLGGYLTRRSCKPPSRCRSSPRNELAAAASFRGGRAGPGEPGSRPRRCGGKSDIVQLHRRQAIQRCCLSVCPFHFVASAAAASSLVTAEATATTAEIRFIIVIWSRKNRVFTVPRRRNSPC